ncbi:hypothetical protein BFW38_11480 [Terasakiispira papahanaumokuakeensis]|uniref:DUF962 domain-containing protein n=1 Tax=Terasakiispira papahanaumokuakeensis TaxID=197479 RepID=A0A1E2VAR2_9GAMM|nr:Mpo1-like protein [Terasakiispira papahanaumokuakeensis]ODC04061.1 hypothetical protein BFW38_11480 [Terasakiispira papahanaumokuakeensis]
MKTIETHLSQYAAYHRDWRNIQTHLVGIPMIVLAVTILLSRPVFTILSGWPITPALWVASALSLFYLRLDRRLGVLMAAYLGLNLLISHWIAQGSTTIWLSSGLSLFVVGWIFQLIGHYYEGRKPAFVDDVIGLIIGPLFVAAELLFLWGAYSQLEASITALAGPVRRRPPARSMDS